MNKEKSAFPNSYNTEDSNGITYRQYLAARVYPKVMEFIWLNNNRLNAFKGSLQEAAELTWQAVDVLIEAEED